MQKVQLNYRENMLLLMKAREKEQNLRKKGSLSIGTALISAINAMECQETKSNTLFIPYDLKTAAMTSL